jgi:glucose/arabinose dehydrogenase
MRHAWKNFIALTALGGAPAMAQFTVSGPGVNPADFRITTFASGLNHPYGMTQLSDGSLLVATRTGTDFFSAPGQLLRLTDVDQNGVADGPGSLLASGLPIRAISLEQAGNLVLVGSGSETGGQITILRKGASPSAPLIAAGTINLSFSPQHPYHSLHALTVRPTPSQPGQFDVFFNIGSANNNAATTPGDVTVTGVGGGSLTADSDSIYKVTIQDNGSSVTASSLTQVAAGLRNAAGMLVHPNTGDLYFQDNGIDNDAIDGGNEPLSADELNRITQANVGGAVENFGFPSNYIQYRTGTEIGSGGVDPIVAFQPIPSPNGSESEGAAEIAFAPAFFPGAVNNGIFVGFHGKFVEASVTNEENPLVFYNPTTNSYFHFIDNSQPVGHLDGLLSTSDSLFLSDFSRTGFDSTTGAIYQIKTLVPEAVWVGGAGNWSDSVKWIGGVVPSGAALHAKIDGNNPAGSSVSLDQDVALARISLDANDALTIQPTRTLTLAGPGTNVVAGTLTSSGTLAVTGGTTVLAKGLKGSGALTIASAAKVTIPAAAPSGYDPDNNILPIGNNATGSRISSLTIAGSGQLDLGNSDLAIDHDGSLSVSTIAALVASGYNGGTWDGPGIVASAALLDTTVFGLGYAENGDPNAIPDPYNSDTNPFFGIPVDNTSVLLKFTWVGDLNLDGFVNFSDLVVFNGSYDDGATSGRFWFEGDFNYDGSVDFSDLVLFNGAYDENKASMPEPCSTALFLVGACFAVVRRASRRHV